MKYILDEDEYRELKSRKEMVFAKNTEELQALCTLIAMTMPVSVHWINKG